MSTGSDEQRPAPQLASGSIEFATPEEASAAFDRLKQILMPAPESLPVGTDSGPAPTRCEFYQVQGREDTRCTRTAGHNGPHAEPLPTDGLLERCASCGQMIPFWERTRDGGHLVRGSVDDHCGPVEPLPTVPESVPRCIHRHETGGYCGLEADANVHTKGLGRAHAFETSAPRPVPETAAADPQEGYCAAREDKLHCDHWWDESGPCCACGFTGEHVEGNELPDPALSHEPPAPPAEPVEAQQ